VKYGAKVIEDSTRESCNSESKAVKKPKLSGGTSERLQILIIAEVLLEITIETYED